VGKDKAELKYLDSTMDKRHLVMTGSGDTAQTGRTRTSHAARKYAPEVLSRSLRLEIHTDAFQLHGHGRT
jgi:hypothetical protein